MRRFALGAALAVAARTRAPGVEAGERARPILLWGRNESRAAWPVGVIPSAFTREHSEGALRKAHRATGLPMRCRAVRVQMRSTPRATGNGRNFCGALLMAGMLFSASGAAAEDVRLTPEMRTDLSERIDIKLTGRIDPRCQMSGGGEVKFGELRGGEGASALFGLDCNVPFDIDMRSSYGGLSHMTQPMGEGPFSGLLEYDVRLSLPTLRPTPAMVQGSYSSRQLMAKRTLSSGDGIAAGGGSLEFRMRRPEGVGLLAGAYRETLTLTVTPRM